MKQVLLSTFFLAYTCHSFAQSNFYKVSIGGGAGITQSFTEVKKHDFGLAAYGTLDYLLTPFLSLGLEAQKGEINGGDYDHDPQHRQFTNSYLALSLNGKISLGEIIDNNYNNTLNKLRGLYFGTGLGALRNKMKYIIRHDREDPEFVLPGANASKDIFIPLNLGINFFFADRQGFYRYVLNFNYQGNITLGEGLDGYDNTSVTFESGNPDIYTFFSAGIKYNFGPMGLSRKTFHH